MLITSPEDRAILWREAIAYRGDERASRLRFIASDLLTELRTHIDLYGGYEDQLVETILMLGDSELFLDNEMLAAYQAIGPDAEAPARLFALVISRLDTLVTAPGVAAEVGRCAGELGETWRELIASTEEDELLSVAHLAARYGVTPQAVYKWIHSGKIVADETPGGSYRIPASQFRTGRDKLRRRSDLRRRLAEKMRGQEIAPDEVIVSTIRESRRD